MKNILTGIGITIVAVVGFVFYMAFYGVIIVGSIWLGLTIINWII